MSSRISFEELKLDLEDLIVLIALNGAVDNKAFTMFLVKLRSALQQREVKP